MKLRFASICAMAASALAARPCHADTPLAYFLHSGGPAAQPVRVLGWGLAALCAFVIAVIAVLLAIALAHRRASMDGDERAANTIVGIGTGISTLLLFASLVAMLRVLVVVAQPAREPAFTLHVTAYDWWWKASYPQNAGTDGAAFDTANEIHIPTGVPVRVALDSADVIHAFWVPTLAGKTQTIPGQTNHQWLQADHPGVYRGQCTQFCGAQHAHMAFEVIAQTPEQYASWLDAQRRPAAPAATPAAQRGERLFDQHCAACHAIRGTDAHGAQAPDLTHLLSRRLIAAGTLENTPANLKAWIAHAQQIKPGTLMPNFDFAPADAHDLDAWLATLQ
jgi:cytochrome c oxidase subunit 2